MFVEVNEVARYNIGSGSYQEYKTVTLGKILINTDTIRCVAIAGVEWINSDKAIMKEGSQRYCVYFDKDRSVYIDLESYNKIKEAVIKKEQDTIFE